MSTQSPRGFTLIELLVVIAIIALLSSVVLSSLNSARTKARDAKRIAEVRQLVNAIEIYYSQNGYYPTQTSIIPDCNVAPNGTSLNVLVSSGIMAALPADPTNKTSSPMRLCYQYLGIGNSSYPSNSEWYCSGRRRTDYQYSLFFSTESATTNYPLVTNSGGTPNNEFKYCVPGPLI